jgi:hypothetical protein
MKEVKPIVKQHKKKKEKRVMVRQEAKTHVGTLEEYFRVRPCMTNHNLPLNYTM